MNFAASPQKLLAGFARILRLLAVKAASFGARAHDFLTRGPLQDAY
jgi:hypothetical protein